MPQLCPTMATMLELLLWLITPITMDTTTVTTTTTITTTEHLGSGQDSDLPHQQIAPLNIHRMCVHLTFHSGRTQTALFSHKKKRTTQQTNSYLSYVTTKQEQKNEKNNRKC